MLLRFSEVLESDAWKAIATNMDETNDEKGDKIFEKSMYLQARAKSSRPTPPCVDDKGKSLGRHNCRRSL